MNDTALISTKMSNENKIELLWNCAKTLNSDQHTHKLLKSYYINTCRKLAKTNLLIPKEKFALSQMCCFCGSFWSESEFSLKLIPKKLKLSPREKRLIENFSKNDGSIKTNKSQKNRAKWLMKKHFKSLAIYCQLCKHKSVVNMKNERNKSLTHPPPKNNNGEETIVAPKKSNKDFLVTLKKKDDMLSFLTQPKKAKIVEKQITSNCKTKTKTSQKLSNKLTSKTQKNNSLLQLAALLQKQTNVDEKSVAQKKLQSLLK